MLRVEQNVDKELFWPVPYQWVNGILISVEYLVNIYICIYIYDMCCTADVVDPAVLLY